MDTTTPVMFVGIKPAKYRVQKISEYHQKTLLCPACIFWANSHRMCSEAGSGCANQLQVSRSVVQKLRNGIALAMVAKDDGHAEMVRGR